jgi:hypothetical protein
MARVVGLALLALVLPASASAAELSVTIDRSPGRVFVWQELEYAISVTNAGPDTATDVRVTLAPAARVETVSAFGELGQCSWGRSGATCDIPALDPGAVAGFSVVVRPLAPGRLAAEVEVVAAGAPDANPVDNAARVVATVRLVPGACSNLRRGTAARDVVAGTRGGDAVFGRGGNDLIRGARGEDCLSGQDGDDTLRGGGGADTFFGDAGADVIDGGGGDDLANGGSGPDRIEGAEQERPAAGDDHIVAPPDATVRCGPGRDFVRLLGEGTVSGCERVVRPPPPPPPAFPPPTSGGGGGGGQTGGGDDGGGFRPRSRHRRCSRRYCRRGGIPASIPLARPADIDPALRPRP